MFANNLTNPLIRFVPVALLTLCVSSIIHTQIAVSESPRSQEVKAVLPEDIEWENNLNMDGIQTATVLGDPSNAELYVLFGKMPAKSILKAHTHPDDRITTVLSGTMYYGVGQKFNRAEVKSYPKGSIVYIPANVPHFIWAKDEEIILQHTGVGPTEIDFVDTRNN